MTFQACGHNTQEISQGPWEQKTNFAKQKKKFLLPLQKAFTVADKKGKKPWSSRIDENISQ